ncbi:hypothetical protein BC834DRAFT_847571 [Gloeopeniophorella convolvens]|nr:hypothetical protein BC834DRAFT_847571 [Gloeopeniophorella convolvens]
MLLEDTGSAAGSDSEVPSWLPECGNATIHTAALALVPSETVVQLTGEDAVSVTESDSQALSWVSEAAPCIVPGHTKALDLSDTRATPARYSLDSPPRTPVTRRTVSAPDWLFSSPSPIAPAQLSSPPAPHDRTVFPSPLGHTSSPIKHSVDENDLSHPLYTGAQVPSWYCESTVAPNPCCRGSEVGVLAEIGVSAEENVACAQTSAAGAQGNGPENTVLKQKGEDERVDAYNRGYHKGYRRGYQEGYTRAFDEVGTTFQEIWDTDSLRYNSEGDVVSALLSSRPYLTATMLQ